LPFYYDLNTSATTSGTSGNSQFQTYGFTNTTNQETLNIVGVYAASRFGQAGGAQLRVLTGFNSTNSTSLGTAQTAQPRNLIRNPAAVSSWLNGPLIFNSTLTPRLTVGFAQTGGMGGWVPITPQDGIQATVGRFNPSDINFLSQASNASVTYDQTIEMTEGI
jgi:hypothetical protein